MEATALSVGKSVLSGALSYAKSALAEEVALQLGVRRDQVFITNELEIMQAFLMAAHDERDDNMVVKVWVKQVRDVAYDVEDTLQEFAVRLEKKSWWHFGRTLQDRHHVAKQMKELRANVEEVSHRNMRYQLIKGSSSKPANISRQSVTGTTMSGIEEARRQEDRAKFDLIQIVSKKEEADLRVIAVWGKSMAELGELSILKRVYEDPKIRKMFECRAWITPSLHPINLSEFLKTVVGQFYINFLQEAKEEEKATLGAEVPKIMGMTKKDDLAQEFKKFLKERSYLVVLNGIIAIEDWDLIKTCFPDNKKGSRIIVSTEQVGVASLCVGAENGAPEHKQLFADQTLHVFCRKGSQHGMNSAVATSGTNIVTTGVNNYPKKNILTRLDTLVMATLEESRLIGRGSEKNEIIKLVSDKDVHQFRVVSLWGMGGIGKTTLVRDIYQSEEISGTFEERACVTVMRPFNCDKLLKNLTTQFRHKDPITDITVYLREKRYLLVLDDVSSTSEWDAIIKYLPKAKTSCIIVTTREENIAKHCSDDERSMYKLKNMNHEDALILFTKKVFKETLDLEKQYPELVEQAEMILRKCNGLPLAIVTIGGFLANQPKSALEWRKLNENISAELELNPELETIRSILMRSYDGLPYHLKSCFLYMPIFPEDQSVGRGRLVRRWAAEGYSREVRGKSMEEIADGYFMELLSRSMLLPSQESIHSTKGIESCQVHDLMRDIGISKSMEENLVFTVEKGCSSNSQATMRHLAISNNWEGDQYEFESMVDLSRVRSITCFGEWKPFFISETVTLLRVLDLENTTGLTDDHLKHIWKLLHLRYLSLRGCHHICHLPDSLGNLRELQTLDVRGTRINKLPKSIINLQKLNNLCAGMKMMDEDISYEESKGEGAMSYRLCIVPAAGMRPDKYGVLVPKGMSKLKGLRTLGIVNIAREGKDILHDMKRLTWLHKLGVTGVNKENGQELYSAIVGMRRLESLSIRSEGEPGLSGCLDGDYSSAASLLRLKLYGNLVKLPKWIQELNNVVKLKLRSSRISTHDDAMQVLGNLPNLASLHLLEKSFQLGNFCLSFHSGTFPSLVVLEVGLRIDFMGDVRSLKFKQGTAPKLELLKFCTSINDSESILGLPSLASLKDVVLENFCDGFELAYMRTELARNPNRPVLKML
ncbi:disease resistance protein Pik-2-like [Aegilops tauschii subsp. strangulata]|uniref:Disease resistance protein RPM1 n=3 Tax=Aegilops tauschii TaxID=37682 RepID=A0A453A614_AEGTS|nr:disease resistance protein Pik-2-like [Aegilops tauschii subsp. strangulata]